MTKVIRKITRCFLRWKVFLTLFMVWVGLLVAAITLSNTFSPCVEWVRIIASLMVNLAAFYLVLNFGYQKLLNDIKDADYKKTLSDVITFWDFGNQDYGYILLHGGYVGNFFDDTKMKSSKATIYSLLRIEETLRQVHGRDILVEQVETRSSNVQKLLETHNVIILGGYLSIPEMEDFPRRLGVKYKQDFTDKEERKIVPLQAGSRRVTFTSHPPHSNYIDTDYATVTRIFDSVYDRTIYWFSGNYGLATYASVIYFTTPGFLKLCPPDPGFGKEFFVQQFVIEVEKINKNHIDPKHRSIRVAEDNLSMAQKNVISRELLDLFREIEKGQKE